MKQVIQDALSEGVSLQDIFETYVPRAHDMQKDMFSRISKVPLIVSFWFEDIDERYTYEFSQDGAEVEAGDMVDFPLVTVVLQHAQWESLRPRLRRILLTLQDNKQQLEQRYISEAITPQALSSFESLHGHIEVHVEDIDIKVILNDYEANEDDPSFGITLSHDLLDQVVAGEVSPRDLASKVQISGQMSFALKLAAFFTAHFKM